MKSSKIYKSLLALAAPFLLAACSSEEGVDTPVVEQEFEGIELAVPYSAANTRADVAATDNEAKIEKLYVVAYPTSASGNTAVFSYDANGYSITSNHILAVGGNTTYAKVDVALKPGTYNIYVFANVSPSNLKKSDGTTALTIDASSEADLKTATFGDQSPILASSVTASANYIPMSCMADDLKKGAGLNAEAFGTDGVEIEKGKATAVYANLTFCYSKVRFTLLNDVADIDVPTLTLKNSAKKLGLLSGIKYGAGNDLQDVTLTATKYACPASVPTTTDGLKTFNVDNLGAYQTGDKKWAQQGTWYIPERLYPDENPAKSALSFDFGTGNEAYNKAQEVNEFERGKYYDFVAYIQNKIVYVEVRVNKWDYYKADIIDLE